MKSSCDRNRTKISHERIIYPFAIYSHTYIIREEGFMTLWKEKILKTVQLSSQIWVHSCKGTTRKQANIPSAATDFLLLKPAGQLDGDPGGIQSLPPVGFGLCSQRDLDRGDDGHFSPSLAFRSWELKWSWKRTICWSDPEKEPSRSRWSYWSV